MPKSILTKKERQEQTLCKRCQNSWDLCKRCERKLDRVMQKLAQGKLKAILVSGDLKQW